MFKRMNKWLMMAITGLLFAATSQAQDSVSVSFSVNLGVQQQLGIYNPSIHTPGIAGSFNGWSSTTLTDQSDTTFSATFLFDSLTAGDQLLYKFILVDTVGTITWERDFAAGNRVYTYMGTETDTNADGYKDIILNHVFNDRGNEYLQLPVPPHTSGTVINLNGSFASSDTASSVNQTLSWYNYVFEGSSTFAVVTDAQDGDNRAVRASVSYNGSDLVEHTELIQEPILAEEGKLIRQSIWLKADAPGRKAEIWVSLNNNRGYETRNSNFVDLSTTWTEYVFEYVGNSKDAEHYIRAGVSLNFPENNGASITIDNQKITSLDAPAVPLPPYAIGDRINLNGSFELAPLGILADPVLAWQPYTLNNDLTSFEIVSDSQDGDGASVKVNTAHNGTDDRWNVQMIHEPLNVQAGDYYGLSIWLKADAPGRKAQIYLAQGADENFANIAELEVDVPVEWTKFSFGFLADLEDQNSTVRAGVSLNYAENEGGAIWVDNLSLVKEELVITNVNFSVNTSVAAQNGYFSYPDQKAQLVGSINGWDIGNAIDLSPASGDSVFGVNWELYNVEVGDTLFYKFILRDSLSGNFEWDSPDPANPATTGEFSDRFVVLTSQSDVTLPTAYYSDFEPADRNPDNYGITSIADSRLDAVGTHLAVEGIVTSATTNWVHLQDESGAGTMIFSRPFFSDNNSVAFNLAVQNSEINVGDRIKVSGVVADFGGLHEIIRIHGWTVVSTGNALPDAQSVFLSEVTFNGEEYESELVSVSRFQLVNPVDTLFSGIYDIVSEDGTETGYLYIPGAANSEWAGQPAIQGLMSFNGVIREVFDPASGQNQYMLSAQYLEDLVTASPSFFGELSLSDLNTLPNRSWNYPLYLDDVGVDSIFAFEFTFSFDPAGVNLSLAADQTGTLAENYSVITNTPTPGELRVAGASTQAITATGELFALTLDVLDAGEYFITVDDPLINEGPADPFLAFINVVPRLCGDVTGDESVSTLDATSVLRHTVLLSPEYPLSGIDSTAADVTGNGDISAFDASLILQKEVGLISGLGCISLPLKETPQKTHAGWFVNSTDDGTTQVDLDLTASEFDIMSVELELDLENGISFSGFENLPDSWNSVQNMVDGKLRLSLYGISPIEDKVLKLSFSNPDVTSGVPGISGSLVLNENAMVDLSELRLAEVPTEFKLDQNYPNPFNPSTNISYSIPTGSDVELSVFNMLGQKVATLVSETQEAGTYSVSWNAANMSSGMYLYQLRTGSFTTVKRMLLVK